MAEGYGMDYTAIMERLNNSGGGDLKLFGKVGPIFQTIYSCKSAAK